MTVDIPLNKPARYSDLSAFLTELEEVGGMAVAAFKNPESARLLDQSGPMGFRDSVSGQSVRAALDKLETLGVEIIKYYRSFAAVSVVLTPSIATILFKDPLIDYIEPENFASLDGTENAIPRISSFAQSTPWGISAVEAPNAWDATSGQSATLMIIDTGHDQGHGDLPSVPSSNCGGLYDGCTDDRDHGTHVFGIAAALNNGLGVVGTAPGVSAFDTYVWGACGENGCSTSSIIEGIDSAAILGIDVVNMSISQSEYHAGWATSITAASDSGVVMVSSAGNHCHNVFVCPETNESRFPANHSRVIGVSGINSNLSFAHPSSECGDVYSNFGVHVDLSAPYDAYSTVDGGGYGTKCGNSMATPHVAGVAAMIRALAPWLSPLHVRWRLNDTATDLGPSGWDSEYGEGVVNAYQATGPHVFIEGPVNIMPNVTCTWWEAAEGGYGSLSFEWYKNGSYVGSSSNYSTSASSDFQLQLVVSDGQNVVSESHFTVSVDSGHDECDA